MRRRGLLPCSDWSEWALSPVEAMDAMHHAWQHESKFGTLAITLAYSEVLGPICSNWSSSIIPSRRHVAVAHGSAHPNPNVLSDSSKVARFTLGQGLRVVSFSTDKEIWLCSNVRTALVALLCILLLGFAWFIVAAWNHEGSVFYVRRSSTLIITCFFLRCFISIIPCILNKRRACCMVYVITTTVLFPFFLNHYKVWCGTGAQRHTRRTWVAIPLIRLDFIFGLVCSAVQHSDSLKKKWRYICSRLFFCLVCSAVQHSDSFLKKRKENGAIYGPVVRPLFWM